jgi:superoxide dismutase, Cu-Zn family
MNGANMDADRTSTQERVDSGQARPHRTARVLAPVAVATLIAAGVVGVNSVSSSQDADAEVTASAQPLAIANSSDHRPRQARAILRSADGSTLGSVTFTRRGSRTELKTKLAVLPGLTAVDAFHGFHVHANDKPENGNGCLADPAQPPATWFTSADGHLAEPGQKHAHHTGDMPSLLVNDDGTATLESLSSRMRIADLLNRAVVLHAGPDNFGNVPTGTLPDQYTANSTAATDKSAATGNAGDRVACGVVELVR